MTNIYLLIDPRNSHVRYVGKSNNINARLSRHISEANKCTKTPKKAWIKSLLISSLRPEIYVIDVVDDCMWEFWERHYISLYKSWGFDLTNRTEGGDAPPILRGEMSTSKRKEAREKMSAFRKGKKASNETKIKQRNIKIKAGTVPPSRKGIPLTVNAKEKRRETIKLQGYPRRKRIFAYDKKYNFIGEYSCAEEASKLLFLRKGSITSVANGFRKTYKNMTFTYFKHGLKQF